MRYRREHTKKENRRLPKIEKYRQLVQTELAISKEELQYHRNRIKLPKHELSDTH